MTAETKAIDGGGSAFPTPHLIAMNGEVVNAGATGGMSLRDYFAAKAMQGYLANPTILPPDLKIADEETATPEDMAGIAAIFARMCADALLEELRTNTPSVVNGSGVSR